MNNYIIPEKELIYNSSFSKSNKISILRNNITQYNLFMLSPLSSYAITFYTSLFYLYNIQNYYSLYTYFHSCNLNIILYVFSKSSFLKYSHISVSSTIYFNHVLPLSLTFESSGTIILKLFCFANSRFNNELMYLFSTLYKLCQPVLQ